MSSCTIDWRDNPMMSYRYTRIACWINAWIHLFSGIVGVLSLGFIGAEWNDRFQDFVLNDLYTPSFLIRLE